MKNKSGLSVWEIILFTIFLAIACGSKLNKNTNGFTT